MFQAFRFALDPTPAQVGMFFRFSGARRKACNWAVEQMQANVAAYREDGAESPYPSFFTMKKAWNAAKPEVCVDADTGAAVVAGDTRQGVLRPASATPATRTTAGPNPNAG